MSRYLIFLIDYMVNLFMDLFIEHLSIRILLTMIPLEIILTTGY